jgi:hypothetical protein
LDWLCKFLNRNIPEKEAAWIGKGVRVVAPRLAEGKGHTFESCHRPAPPSTGLNDLQPFNLSTVLIAVQKHSFTSINLNQQGGLNRRETFNDASSFHIGVSRGQRMHPSGMVAPAFATVAFDFHPSIQP